MVAIVWCLLLLLLFFEGVLASACLFLFFIGPLPMFVSLSVFLSVSLFVFLSVSLSVSLSAFLSVLICSVSQNNEGIFHEQSKGFGKGVVHLRSQGDKVV